MENPARHARLVRTQLTKIDDTGNQQLVNSKGLAGEVLGEKRMVARLQNFGMSSTPPIDSHGFALQMNGARGMATILGMEHPDHRPKELDYGETVLYDAAGNAVSLVQKKIRIVSPVSVEIVAPEIALNGNVVIGGTFGEGKPASFEGTVDDVGHADVGNFATKVKLV